MNLEEIDDIYESRKFIYVAILEISPKSRFGPYARFHARRNGDQNNQQIPSMFKFNQYSIIFT